MKGKLVVYVFLLAAGMMGWAMTNPLKAGIRT